MKNSTYTQVKCFPFARVTLASGHLDNNLRFWDVRSGKDIKEMTGIHLGQITSVSVSPGTMGSLLVI